MKKFILVVIAGFLFSLSSLVSAGHARSLSSRTASLENKVDVLQSRVSAMDSRDILHDNNLDLLVEMYAHGPAVVTSPALGVRRSRDDARDLMVSLPSVQEDLVLLKLRKKMDDYAFSKGILIPERPIIALSGGLEGRVDYVHNYNKTERNDVNLSRAQLDVIGEASPWATGAMVISYDDAKMDGATRVNNSRLRIDRGFLTIGQLNKCPLYFTIGQIYAPFGKYSSYMVTGPSTKGIGKFKDRMVVLGFSQEFVTRASANTVISAQAYGYPGELKVKENDILDHVGFNLDVEFSQDKFKLLIGGSYIGNIAESNGMQKNIFNEDPLASDEDKGVGINTRVYGIDGRIKVNYDMFTVLAEYVGAGKHFNVNDLSFNGKAAKPQAVSVEGAVEFKVLDRPNTLAIGYGQTWQALALKLPRNTLFAEYSVSIWKNTIFSLEYRHDINYNWGDTGQGNGVLKEVKVGGRHKNTVTAQIGIYF